MTCKTAEECADSAQMPPESFRSLSYFDQYVSQNISCIDNLKAAFEATFVEFMFNICIKYA